MKTGRSLVILDDSVLILGGDPISLMTVAIIPFWVVEFTGLDRGDEKVS